MPKLVAIARSTLPGTNPDGVSVGDCWLAKSSRLLDISVHLAKWMDCSISLLTHVATSPPKLPLSLTCTASHLPFDSD
jgi:hypothetical protein